ncbi:hypothetical protein FPC62_27510, partial [Salmonella enterica]|nr:hypothetical protein [Salmonella enterica]
MNAGVIITIPETSPHNSNALSCTPQNQVTPPPGRVAFLHLYRLNRKFTMRLASRFGRINQIRRDRPLTREEL